MLRLEVSRFSGGLFLLYHSFLAPRPLQVVKSFQDSSCTVPDIVVLFSKKTRIDFFVNKHQPCQQVDCGESESLANFNWLGNSHFDIVSKVHSIQACLV